MTMTVTSLQPTFEAAAPVHRDSGATVFAAELRPGDEVTYPDGWRATVRFTHRLDLGQPGWLIAHVEGPDRLVAPGDTICVTSCSRWSRR